MYDYDLIISNNQIVLWYLNERLNEGLSFYGRKMSILQRSTSVVYVRPI